MISKLISFLNAYSQGKTGGDMVFIEVAKRLSHYQQNIITSRLGSKLCQEHGLTANFFLTTQEDNFKNIIRTYLKRTFKALFFQCDLQKKDLILASSDFLPDVLPAFLLRLRHRQAKWVQHVFHLIPFSRKIPFVAQRISFVLIRPLADLIIVDNDFLRQDLIKMGFPAQKVFVNHPGIDLANLNSVSQSSQGLDGIFMARLHPSKGIFDLIKIWQIVCSQIPEARLELIGKGNDEIVGQLKKSIAEAKLENNVQLLGYLGDKEAFGLIKASRVFLFPSHEEGFGIAPLEAQALGLPVVAWDLPVFDEVFPQGMVKIPRFDLAQFANKVVELLQDNQLYHQLSNQAHENANQYSWDKVAEKELELIAKIV